MYGLHYKPVTYTKLWDNYHMTIIDENTSIVGKISKS